MPANSFAIIKSGDFELVKTKLNQVHINLISGIVSVQLQNGRSINSDPAFQRDAGNGVAEDSRATYVGSPLEEKINKYLGSMVN